MCLIGTNTTLLPYIDMKLASYFYLLSTISLAFTSPILHLRPSEKTQYEYPPSSKLLKQELSSILLADLNMNANLSSLSNNFKEPDDILLIPKSYLFEKQLNDLGLKDLVNHSKKFRLQSQSNDPSLEILIPEDATPFFIFNSTNSLELPQEQTKAEYTKFIEHSAPFKIPDSSCLIDYFLVLPIPENFKYSKSLVSKLNHDVITLSSDKLPLFKHEFSRSTNPLLVFLFKSGESVIENKEINEPSMNTKPVVESQFDLDQFFDFFATSWTKNKSFSKLVHGIFCTLNVNFVAQSYCIKVKEDLNSLALFPVYHEDQRKLEKRQRLDIFGAHKVITYLKNELGSERNELHIPLSILKAPNPTDLSNSFEIFNSTGKVYNQVVSKLNSLYKTRVPINLMSRLGKRSINTENIKDIQDKLHQRLKTKNIKDKMIKQHGTNFIISKLKESNAGNTGDNQRSKIKVVRTRPLSNNFEIYGSKAAKLKGQGIAPMNKSDNDNTSTRARKTSRKDPAKLTPYHSQGEKPNELFLAPENQRGSKVSDFGHQDCEPVTWYNVFHHSVFGKTKFCGIDE